MGTTTQLMTFEEFSKLPDEVCRRSELRHGELVTLADPKQIHVWLQHRLMRLLDRRADDFGIVSIEVPFRPKGDYEYYRVDVAFVSRERWKPDRKGNLLGAPEIVVEILSPSNTPDEMRDRQRLFFESGCLQFWEVSVKFFEIYVTTPDGTTTTYRRGERIPLPFLGGGFLAVDDVFEGIEE